MTGTTLTKEFATEREVSDRFGLGVKQLRYHRMRGDGPPWRKVSGSIGRKGGRILYNTESVRAWIENQPGGGERLATA